MNAAPAYVHALDGRLRVKSATVKGSSRKALEVERRLRGQEGITEVTTNPTTGSVLVLYDSNQIGQGDILAILSTLGCLPQNRESRMEARVGTPVRDGFGHALVRTVMISTMEFAVQRLVYALI